MMEYNEIMKQKNQRTLYCTGKTLQQSVRWNLAKALQSSFLTEI